MFHIKKIIKIIIILFLYLIQSHFINFFSIEFIFPLDLEILIQFSFMIKNLYCYFFFSCGLLEDEALFSEPFCKRSEENNSCL